jgi:ribonuclease P protein component
VAATRLLPKERRLLKKSDFDRVFSHGRAAKLPGTRLIWAQGSGRAAVVVAKAVGRTAYRNTIKRRWREALTPEMLPEQVDFVLIVGKEALHLRGKTVAERIESLLREACL